MSDEYVELVVRAVGFAEVGDPPAMPALAACAQRFRDSPFLGFAIRTATDRIN